MRGKSTSEHNFPGHLSRGKQNPGFSGFFRVFQGFSGFSGFFRVFQGLPGSSRVCWPPCISILAKSKELSNKLGVLGSSSMCLEVIRVCFHMASGSWKLALVLS